MISLRYGRQYVSTICVARAKFAGIVCARASNDAGSIDGARREPPRADGGDVRRDTHWRGAAVDVGRSELTLGVAPPTPHLGALIQSA